MVKLAKFNENTCIRQGGDTRRGVAALRFMLIDGPVAVVKPCLMQHQTIPAGVDAMLRAAHDAVRAWATTPTD